jgi:hypothetical protein
MRERAVPRLTGPKLLGIGWPAVDISHIHHLQEKALMLRYTLGGTLRPLNATCIDALTF